MRVSVPFSAAAALLRARAVVLRRTVIRRAREITWRIRPMRRLWYPRRYRILRIAEILHVNLQSIE